MVRLGCEGLLESHRERPDQDGPYQRDAFRLLRRRAWQRGLRLRRRQPRLSARYGRHRCLQHDALQCPRLAQRGDLRAAMRFRTRWRTSDSRGNSDITTPGGQRTVSGGFVQLKNNYSTCARGRQCGRYDRYHLDFRDGVDGRRPLLAEDHRRRDAGGGLHALCQLCRRLPRTFDHGNARERAACRRYRQRLVLPLPVGYAGTRCRLTSASCQIRTCGRRSARTRKSAST